MQLVVQENILRSNCSRNLSSAILILHTLGLFQQNLPYLLAVLSYRRWGLFSIITLIYSYSRERYFPLGSNSHMEKFTFVFKLCYLSVSTSAQQIPSHTLRIKPATITPHRTRWDKSHIYHTRLTQQMNYKVQTLKKLFKLSLYLFAVWTNVHVR